MKPEQFIRDFGPNFVNGIPESATHVSGFTGQVYRDSSDNLYVWDGANWHKSIYKHTRGMILVSKLKRLVKSVEIINQAGGYEVVKTAISNYRASGDMVTFSSLEKRLKDHESIYGGGDE
ncbi:hypothetical protein OCUAc17_12070 [Acinetobacter pittii]|uniref:hypothetical protein n=1 Tax=Acinetobacter TaxID=469 RepID=UPI0001CF7D54|nr:MULTISPECIES: hypothetical protein [Acinetobacter]EFF86439.1 hypothetical protein HMPREF0013_01772 [Acinetobacter sp. SH024]BCZ09832.1 hypothetical protein OCUAc17_12070 [Acinetobacter pittii]